MHSRSSSFWRRYQIPIFFVLAYALSWLVWGTYIAQQHGLLSFHLPESFFAYFALTLATVIVAWFAGGKSALLDLLHRLLRWRVGIQWYALALLVPVVLSLLPAAIYWLFGRPVPMGVAVPLGAAVVYFFTFGAKAWVTEEIAWRGFALPRLESGRSALAASVILGLLWGVWHTPLFLIAGTAQSGWPYIGFLLFAIAESILVTWIYNNSRGSVLLATIFHAATDAALSFSGVLFGDQLLFWLTVAIFWVAAIIVVIVAGPSRLIRGKPTEQELAAIAPPDAASREVPETASIR